MFLRSADDAAVAADFDEVKRKLKGGSRNNIKLRVYMKQNVKSSTATTANRPRSDHHLNGPHSMPIIMT